MATYDQLFPYIAPDCPGVDVISMTRAARDAVIEFCRKSLAYERTLDPMLSAAKIAEYEIEPPSGYVVCAVLQAWFDGRKIEQVLNEEVDHDTLVSQFGGVELSGSTPSRVTFVGNNMLYLQPAPAEGSKNITLQCALAPSRTGTEFPDQLFEEYATELGRGAAARLLKTKSLPIYDLNAAAIADAEFRSSINAARLRRMRGGIGRRISAFKMRKVGK